MWTIIIGSILGFLLPVIILWIQEKKYFEFWDYFGLYFICLIVSGFISFGISVALPVTYQKEVSEFELATLQDNSQTTGRFFLGSGFVNGTMKYVFYYKDGESYAMHMVSYSSAEIIITDQKPYIKQISYEKTNDFINYFALDLETPQTDFYFYVPTGTISNSYTLDAF